MRVVIPSVRYADFLAVTLPAWLACLPSSARVTVATTSDDIATQDVALSAGARVCVTDAWTRDGAPFNKGSALDEAFGFARGYTHRPSTGEACLSIDADVYPFGVFPDREHLAADVLYGVTRYHCETPDALARHAAGGRREDLRVIRQRVRGESLPALGAPAEAGAAARACLGYFQLFRYRPGMTFGASKTAGKYDIDFRRHFAHRAALSGLYVLHLGELDRANWRGRVVAPWGATA